MPRLGPVFPSFSPNLRLSPRADSPPLSRNLASEAENPAQQARFVLVDALRGIAALAVVVHHHYGKNLVQIMAHPLPTPLHQLLAEADLGVYVFFVLSGFVISYSMGASRIGPGYFGRFLLRRSIRLDPPYWATIAAMLALTYGSNFLITDRTLSMPSGGAIISHLFYLQTFLGYEHIVGVFWTLCLEIQFYLVLVAGTGMVQALGADDGKRERVARWALFGALWLLALGTALQVLKPHRALFLEYWPYFWLGVLTHWRQCDRISARTYTAVAALTFGLTMLVRPLPMLVAGGTALLLHVAFCMDGLRRWSMGPVMQYLGRISYSLYLTHMLLGSRVARLGARFFGPPLSAWEALLLLGVAIAVDIVVAHAMYVLIEGPAHRLSKRIRMKALPVPVAATT
jgi:peptidoglycan/LPS O-acetylase OafA/YrhL